MAALSAAAAIPFAGWAAPAPRLNRQAQAAEQAGFPHGVSVTSPASNARLSRDSADAVSAPRQAFEDAGFPVHHTPTRRDPDHQRAPDRWEYQIPVDKVDRFNELTDRRTRVSWE